MPRIVDDAHALAREAWQRLCYAVAVKWHRITGQPLPRPPFDSRRAAELIGKYVIVGVTDHDSERRVLAQRQVHGIVIVADPERGIAISLKGRHLGETFWLPPDLRSLRRARPGEYRLRSTGEAVWDPDFVCTWLSQQPRQD